MKLATVFGILTASILATQAMAGDAPPATPSLTIVVTNTQGEQLAADSFGKTLYTFDLDIGKTAPACNGDCAEAWPPYILSQAEAASLKAPLGAIQRANKKIQLTFAGKPVYTYIFDRFPTDEKGDGLGGVWHYIQLN